MPSPEPHASELARWIHRFLTYLVVERGASELTKRNYEFYLTQFVSYSRLTKPEQITIDDVRDFRLFPTSGKAPSMIRRAYHPSLYADRT